MKKYLFSLFVTFYLFSLSGIAQFVTPIEGQYGKDFVIVNYPDWGLGFSIKDHNCGSKTYDGHQGTDIVIRGFPQMDSGVFVLAANDGVVFRVIDGFFDRETVSDTSKKLGNYIEIYHATSNTWSYYAHLRKNSMLVKYGDTVAAGQRIAQVGSSGNSTDPHVHFELWYNAGSIIDPFSGSCGNPGTYWKNPLPYDTSFAVWQHGLINMIPHIDTLRERADPKSQFSNQDAYITFWALQYGLKQGDSTRIEWYNPQGSLWFKESRTYFRDWWYYYYFSSISTSNITMSGKWSYKYYYNNVLATTGEFTFNNPVSIEEYRVSNNPFYYRVSEETIEVVLPEGMVAENVELYSLTGRSLLQKNLKNAKQFQLQLPSGVSSGMYLMKIRHDKGDYFFKVAF